MGVDDRRALEELLRTSNGRPSRVRHFIYVPEKASADGLASQLRRDGFGVETRRAADAVNWLVLAHHLLLPDVDALERICEQLAELAESIGGEYDGWEAEASA